MWLILDRNSASPANEDTARGIIMRGRNNAAEVVNYGYIQTVINDVTDGS
jgi:hypothetical protein